MASTSEKTEPSRTRVFKSIFVPPSSCRNPCVELLDRQSIQPPVPHRRSGVTGNPIHYINLTQQAAQSRFPLVDRAQRSGNLAPYGAAWHFELQGEVSRFLMVRVQYLQGAAHDLLVLQPGTHTKTECAGARVIRRCTDKTKRGVPPHRVMLLCRWKGANDAFHHLYLVRMERELLAIADYIHAKTAMRSPGLNCSLLNCSLMKSSICQRASGALYLSCHQSLTKAAELNIESKQLLLVFVH